MVHPDIAGEGVVGLAVQDPEPEAMALPGAEPPGQALAQLIRRRHPAEPGRDLWVAAQRHEIVEIALRPTPAAQPRGLEALDHPPALLP